MDAICPFCRVKQSAPAAYPESGFICRNCHRLIPARTSPQPATTESATPARSPLRLERPTNTFGRPAASCSWTASAKAERAASAAVADPEVEPAPSPVEPDPREERAAQVALEAIRRQLQAEPAPLPVRREAENHARRIGVMLSKGGVGKTTTAVNLAAGLALAGERVLLVDADTQGQAAFALGVEPKLGLAEFVEGTADAATALTPVRDNLWLLAGGKGLAGLKRLISRKDFGGEQTLAEALAPLDAYFDTVIVDSSPGWDPLTVNVLFYIRQVLVPVALEAMALQGFSEFLGSLAAVKRYRPELTLSYIVPTFLDKRVRGPLRLHEELAALYPERICRPIRYNVKLSEAPSEGKTIFEYAPRSPGARDYHDLARRIRMGSGEKE